MDYNEIKYSPADQQEKERDQEDPKEALSLFA
jgi:hypothetical protein